MLLSLNSMFFHVSFKSLILWRIVCHIHYFPFILMILYKTPEHYIHLMFIRQAGLSSVFKCDIVKWEKSLHETLTFCSQ